MTSFDPQNRHASHLDRGDASSFNRLPVVETEWVAITGGPGSGKTTLIDRLADLGFATSHETARAYIVGELLKGRTIEDVRCNQPEMQAKILGLSLQSASAELPGNVVFFDRGLPDSVGYHRLHGLDDSAARQAAERFRYRTVFFLETVDLALDGVRTETPERAETVGRHLVEAYRDLGYTVVSVPQMSVDERVKFILEHPVREAAKRAADRADLGDQPRLDESGSMPPIARWDSPYTLPSHTLPSHTLPTRPENIQVDLDRYPSGTSWF
jgi:predicted ATPase